MAQRILQPTPAKIVLVAIFILSGYNSFIPLPGDARTGFLTTVDVPKFLQARPRRSPTFFKSASTMGMFLGS